MYYEINVSLNGRHFFATHERSARTSESMLKIVETFKEKFPPSEGYHISVTFYENIGRMVANIAETSNEEILSAFAQ